MAPRRMWLFILPVLIGCGQAAPPAKQGAIRFLPASGGSDASVPSSSVSTAGEMPHAEKALPKREAIQRKILYKATADLVVEDFSSIPSRVEAMAKQFGGYVAQTDISGSPGSPRTGRWTIRVPDSLTALSTVELRVEEAKDYVPEQSPTYLTRLRRSFSASIDLLVTTAQTISIMLVAFSPWLPALFVPLLLLWVLMRPLRHRNRPN